MSMCSHRRPLFLWVIQLHICKSWESPMKLCMCVWESGCISGTGRAGTLLFVGKSHTHTWSGGEADCGSSGVFLNRFFVRSAFKTPLLNSPHSPLSPLFSPPLYLLLSSDTQLLPWCRLLMLLYHLLGSICEDPCTLNLKFLYAFFHIQYEWMIHLFSAL